MKIEIAAIQSGRPAEFNEIAKQTTDGVGNIAYDSSYWIDFGTGLERQGHHTQMGSPAFRWRGRSVSRRSDLTIATTFAIIAHPECTFHRSSWRSGSSE